MSRFIFNSENGVKKIQYCNIEYFLEFYTNDISILNYFIQVNKDTLMLHVTKKNRLIYLISKYQKYHLKNSMYNIIRVSDTCKAERAWTCNI